MNPEARAREKIDEKLEAAGWVVQDRLAMDLGAGPGVVVRESTLDTGEADYVLFVDRKACGVIEAKPDGTTLRGMSDASFLDKGALIKAYQTFGKDLDGLLKEFSEAPVA
jgi:type I restriction enzyme R subunit